MSAPAPDATPTAFAWYSIPCFAYPKSGIPEDPDLRLPRRRIRRTPPAYDAEGWRRARDREASSRRRATGRMVHTRARATGPADSLVTEESQPGSAVPVALTRSPRFWLLIRYALLFGVVLAFASLAFLGVTKAGGKPPR